MAGSESASAEGDTPFRTRFRSNTARFPWWLLIILAAIAYMVVRIATDTNFQSTFLVILRNGLVTTITTTIVAFLIALVIGLVAGLGRVSRNVVLRNLATTYIELVRGVPILVLIFTIAFAVVPGSRAKIENASGNVSVCPRHR